MYLVRTETGMLERENFYSSCPLSEVISDSRCRKVDDDFELSAGYVKRLFGYAEFMIETKLNITGGGNASFFMEKPSGFRYKLSLSAAFSNYRVVLKNSVLELFSSVDDGVNWISRGSITIAKDIASQGFECDGTLTIKDFKVYKGLFFKVGGMNKGRTVKVLDSNGAIILSSNVDANFAVNVQINKPLYGKVVVFDSLGYEIENSDLCNFMYGDVFSFVPFNIKMCYLNATVSNDTELANCYEKLALKNCGNKIYNDVNISVKKHEKNMDVIDLSIDGTTFSNSLRFDKILVNEQKEFFARIVPNNHIDFYSGYFDLACSAAADSVEHDYSTMIKLHWQAGNSTDLDLSIIVNGVKVYYGSKQYTVDAYNRAWLDFDYRSQGNPAKPEIMTILGMKGKKIAVTVTNYDGEYLYQDPYVMLYLSDGAEQRITIPRSKISGKKVAVAICDITDNTVVRKF